MLAKATIKLAAYLVEVTHIPGVTVDDKSQVFHTKQETPASGF